MVMAAATAVVVEVCVCGGGGGDGCGSGDRSMMMNMMQQQQQQQLEEKEKEEEEDVCMQVYRQIYYTNIFFYLEIQNVCINKPMYGTINYKAEKGQVYIYNSLMTFLTELQEPTQWSSVFNPLQDS